MCVDVVRVGVGLVVGVESALRGADAGHPPTHIHTNQPINELVGHVDIVCEVISLLRPLGLVPPTHARTHKTS